MPIGMDLSPNLSSVEVRGDDTGVGHYPGAAMTGEKRNVEQYVRALAAEHGVTAQRNANDRLAQVLTILSGDDSVLDDIEQILVALKRKGVIKGAEVLMLQAEYLNGKQG